jgi:hypothetical protein
MKNLIAKLLGITQSVWGFYGPLLRNFVVTGASALLPIALEIVRSLAQTDKTGAQKRAEAIEALRASALAQGISVTESLIRFTIESAVQRIRIKE